MRIIAQGMAIILILTSSTSCSVNIMEGFAETDTNEAIFFTAKKMVNAGNYPGALIEIGKLTGTYPTKKKVILLKASAKAGVCGLNFVNLVKALKAISTTNLLLFLMNTFRNGDLTKALACYDAQVLIESLGATPATRTDDENMFIAMVSLAKAGTLLSTHLDANNDTIVDNVDYCNAGTFDDTEVGEVGTAINIALHSLAATGSSIAPGTLDTADCALLGAKDFCSVYENDAADFNANQILGIRDMVRSGPATNAIGTHSCAQGNDSQGCDVFSLALPCP